MDDVETLESLGCMYSSLYTLFAIKLFRIYLQVLEHYSSPLLMVKAFVGMNINYLHFVKYNCKVFAMSIEAGKLCLGNPSSNIILKVGALLSCMKLLFRKI